MRRIRQVQHTVLHVVHLVCKGDQRFEVRNDDDVITAYQQKTGIHSIVNTSFNIHEEPIICSPADAIEGFLTSGLDFLYLEGGYLVDFKENQDIALAYLQQDRSNTSIATDSTEGSGNSPLDWTGQQVTRVNALIFTCIMS